MRMGCSVVCARTHWKKFRWLGAGIGVEPSNFKIGLGVGSGIAGAVGANIEV